MGSTAAGFQSTDRYYLDPELGATVNSAMVMENLCRLSRKR